MDAPTVGRYLEHLRRAGTTARYVGNVGFYLAAWAEGLAGLACPGDCPRGQLGKAQLPISTFENSLKILEEYDLEALRCNRRN